MHPETSLAHELDWGDASLSGLVWENDGKDLRLFLAHGSLPISGLLCSWASDLRIDLTWRSVTTSAKRGGPLLSTEGRIKRSRAGRLQVSLNFGSDGELQFECEEIAVLAKSAV